MALIQSLGESFAQVLRSSSFESQQEHPAESSFALMFQHRANQESTAQAPTYSSGDVGQNEANRPTNDATKNTPRPEDTFKPAENNTRQDGEKASEVKDPRSQKESTAERAGANKSRKSSTDSRSKNDTKTAETTRPNTGSVKPDRPVKANLKPLEEQQLTFLKARVKSILRNVVMRPEVRSSNEATRKQPVLKTSTSGSKAIAQAKILRISTQPADSATQRLDGKTTAEHLAARPFGDTSTNNTLQRHSAVLYPTLHQNVAEKTPNRNAGARTKSPAKTPLGSVKRGSKAVRNSAQTHRGVTPNAAPEHLAEAAPQISSTTPEGRSVTTVAQQGQSLARGNSQIAESGLKDANAPNLAGRETANAQRTSAKKSTKRASAARSLSTANWLEALSRRTTTLNRTHPHWKVLEMKLDAGDGNMTIKVMRESEQVSITVAFSDASMQAQAEAQTSQILESLKAQYNLDVNLSFTRREGSAYDFFSSEAAQAKQPVIRGKAIQNSTEEQPLARTSSFRDRNVWIG